MSVCGRCRGRRTIKPSGFGTEPIPCPDCKGGVKQPKPSLGSGPSYAIPGPFGDCAFCDHPAVEYHHVCPKNRVKRLLPEEHRKRALTDRRAGVPVCRPCHDCIERAMLRVEPEHLHPGFWSYVEQWRLEPTLPLYLAELGPQEDT